MSMALALVGIRDYLRQQHSWDHKDIGIQHKGEPPARAKQWYVSIDDGGVATGEDNTDALKETLTIVVGIWRRPGHLPKDFLGQLLEPDDLYLGNAVSLHDLERKIVVGRLGGLHMSYAAMNAVNAKFSLPHEEIGAEFRMPLAYLGRSAPEAVVPASFNAPAGEPFIGYKLRFRGLMRLQKNRGTIG